MKDYSNTMPVLYLVYEHRQAAAALAPSSGQQTKVVRR
jgi:hypothetical protein